MSDAFEENTLSVFHALARDITVNTYTTPPTLRSNRKTIQLQWAPYGEDNEQGLFLVLPMQNHALPCGRPPVWLLAAFGHLRRLQDAPTLDATVEVLNAPQPRPIADPNSNRVSSMARTFRMPTVCVSIRLPNNAATMITAIATKDTLANCCMMSSTCAVLLGLDLDSLEPYDGIIHERFRSAGGPFLRSAREHYTTYKALGSVWLQINLPRTSPFSWDDNKVMVYEDRSLPRGTRYDFIFYSKLIDLLPPQRRKARYNAQSDTHSADPEDNGSLSK
ncbi:hypothetical protein T484DRAFT_1854601 [Baffinella frigidus]|nr:hypothetical protein T484DRAFT_1854601 [Cryptophyta sp. CCMP2293]